MFFELIHSQEVSEEGSKVNLSECLFTFDLRRAIISVCNQNGIGIFKQKIGIITPYKA